MSESEDYGFPLEKGRQFKSEYFTEKGLIALCENNTWLKTRDHIDGIYTEYPVYDYCFSFYVCNSIKELKECFRYGNWSIRQGFIYKDLAFINQVNAGDEWLTVKSDGEKLYSFESCSFRHFDKVNEFEDFIKEMNKATVDQCLNLEYTSPEYNAKYRSY